MGRCGCESAPATGAAMEGSDCIEVTGAGTVGSPFHVDAVVSPNAGNALDCLANGLYVPVASFDDSNCIEVTGDGTAGTPYVPGLIIDPASNNIAECGTAGLLVRGVRLFDTNGVPLGGTAAPVVDDVSWLMQAGVTSGSTDANGDLACPFGANFPTDVFSVTAVMKGNHGNGVFCVVKDVSNPPDEAGFTVRVWQVGSPPATAFASQAVTVSWVAVGW